MKRNCIVMVLALLLALAMSPAAGAEGALNRKDITASSNQDSVSEMLDGRETSSWSSGKDDAAPCLTIALPEDREGWDGLYITWNGDGVPWSFSWSADGVNYSESQAQGTCCFVYEYVSVPREARFLRMEADCAMSILELQLADSQDPTVQQWQPSCEKADLLIVAAHPDDDALFVGSSVPYYATARGKVCQLCFFTTPSRLRQREALRCAWLMGHRYYPCFDDYEDERFDNRDEMARFWGGEERVEASMVGLVRRFKPTVLVTHDVHGEYGHGAHKLMALAAQYAADHSGDETVFPDSAEAYGAWNIPKTYLHIYGDHQITLNLRIPLADYDGKSALEVARLGYLEHESQQQWSFRVDDKYKYSCARFGLYKSFVGDDVICEDFFEHISGDSDLLANPTPTPEPTPTPKPAPTPEPTPIPEPETTVTETAATQTAAATAENESATVGFWQRLWSMIERLFSRNR